MDAATDTAIRLLRESRYDEADSAFRKILAVQADNVDALHGSSVVAFQRGDKARAEQLLTSLLRMVPDRISARYDLACMLIDQARDAEAVELLRRVVAELPDHVNAWYQLGFALKIQDQSVEAETAFRECLKLAPGHTAAANDLARIHRDRGDYRTAIAMFENAAASGQADPSLYHNWWQFASMSALPVLGQTALGRGIAQFPADSDLRIDMAQALEAAGERPQAELQYRIALGLRGGRGTAIGSLLSLTAENASEQQMELARHILKDPSVRAPAKAAVGYGLGKALQARGDYAGAFAAWVMANEARRSEAGALDRAALQTQIDGAVCAFRSEALRAAAAFGSQDERPVFIVGMPRSGTTLVEQIIASHPEAEGLGELPDLSIVAQNFCAAFGARAHWPDAARVPIVGAKALVEAAAHYLKVLDYRLSSLARRAVDKAPMNFFNLGFIAMAFPNARIVWCRREPRDVCLSIYSENFANSQTYATDLADLGVFYRQHERLMQHWQETLPIPVYEVMYERLVADQEQQSRALIDFVGLPWDPACLRFHSTARSVQTPSRWQVRQPMYKTSLQRWRHYEPWLRPLFAALDEDH